MSYWLLKTEPHVFSWENLKKLKKGDSEIWDGVRNFQARNFLREMKSGDLALIYHSGKDREVMGIAKVVKGAFPDPTAKEGDWSAVKVSALQELKKPVSLKEIKANEKLKGMLLVRQSRLSVMPVQSKEFETILKIGETKI